MKVVYVHIGVVRQSSETKEMTNRFKYSENVGTPQERCFLRNAEVDRHSPEVPSFVSNLRFEVWFNPELLEIDIDAMRWLSFTDDCRFILTDCDMLS
ncbi:hypothetical protein NPIL_409721 [Nephila pilipes]|uniref:Uncharacterized protein n=1 Tax=Nephila pilipes TaxID=299642 RepID=A0A8X6NV08_NEPPI|nr:hypothetical protein NPIL_409721 [Nephila pilipes]